ncbi:MAG: acyl-CoA synthetase [Deltaproteobacteria bacterium]|nr:acyl-CoA synthetase [Deltaproteobacteria bacterium]
MNTTFNLAEINEAIAAAIPDRECLIFRDRRLTWAAFNERTRRLGNYLRQRGLGCHRERDGLANHESGQDHLGIYLYNCNEYMEAMLGAYKARVAPFNVNYRYVDEELIYLLRDADARALVYHAGFAPNVARIRAQLPKLDVLLQVADDSGNALLPGAVDYEAALAESSPERPDLAWSPDDLYILYTGGTTGMPKGVLWRQEDIFFGALGGTPNFGPKVASLESVAEAAKHGDLRACPAPPFMHGAAHWMAFLAMHAGGTVIVQDHPERLDPDDIWTTIEREQVRFLTIVGDAFGRPLIDQLDKKSYDLSKFGIILSGGAILTPALKDAFLQRIPHVMIIDGFGASETGGQGQQVSTAGQKATTGTFKMNDQTLVLAEDLSGPVAPGSAASGWLARGGHVPLGYYKDAEKSAKTFPTIGGARYAVPGDHATVAADGTITVLGRGSVSINSGGEKIYPEEVEKALKHHPAVYDAVVVGTPNERFGQQVTAVVQTRDGASVQEAELSDTAAQHLARYKLPRAILFVDEMVRSPSGKADYRWAKKLALERLGLKE